MVSAARQLLSLVESGGGGRSEGGGGLICTWIGLTDIMKCLCGFCSCGFLRPFVQVTSASRFRLLAARFPPLLRLWVVALVASVVPVGQLPGEPADDRFFSALLDRGLYQVAENEALRRLRDDLLKPVERVEWTLRLARAYSRHSEALIGVDRQALVDRADQLLAGLAAESPRLPKFEQVAVERTFLAQRQSELLRLQAEIQAHRPVQDRAIAATESSIEQLRGVLKELSRQEAAARRRPQAELADGHLSAAQIRMLQRDVQFRLAESLVSFVQLAPTSAERSKRMHEADELLKTLSGGWIGEQRTWESRLLRARLARIREDFDTAGSLVRGALRDEPAAWLADRFTAELVRTQLESSRLDDALQTLLETGRQRGALSDELMFLQVRALLEAAAMARSKEDSKTADELSARAGEWLTQIGPGWRQRARILFDQADESNRYGPELASRLQAARAAYASGAIEEALQQFADAAGLAQNNQLTEAADEIEYTQASILLSQERLEEAIAVLERLLERSPSGGRSDEASLLRAYAAGRVYTATPTRANRERYTGLLEEHRSRYSDSPTFAEATWMLANLQEQRNQWTQALELYLQIAGDANHGSESQLRVAVLYEQILDRLRELNAPLSEWEDRAVEDLTGFTRQFPKEASELTAQQAEIVLRVCRIALSHREHPYEHVDHLLAPILAAAETQSRRAERSGVAPDAHWSNIARVSAQLRVVSLAGQGRLQEASRMFESLSLTEPDVLLGLLLGLGELAESLAPQQRQGLGHLQLQAARQLQLQREKLSPEQQETLDRAQAEAYLTTGNVIDAVLIYEQLLKSRPGNPQLLQTLADLYQQQGTRASLQKARKALETLESKQKPGTRPWLETRLNLATVVAAAGDGQQALKLIRLTRVVYPELGGEDLAKQFQSLEQELRP